MPFGRCMKPQRILFSYYLCIYELALSNRTHFFLSCWSFLQILSVYKRANSCTHVSCHPATSNNGMENNKNYVVYCLHHSVRTYTLNGIKTTPFLIENDQCVLAKFYGFPSIYSREIYLVQYEQVVPITHHHFYTHIPKHIIGIQFQVCLPRL